MKTDTPAAHLKIYLRLVVLASFLLGLQFIPLTAISGETGAGQSQPASISDGIYSEGQARRGEQLFKTHCSYCHKDNLSGGFLDDGVGHAPALAGKQAFESSFSERWGGLTLGEMVASIAATMPQQRPGSLSVQEYVDLVCYLLLKNDVPAGAADLPADIETLGRISIPEK